MIKKYLRSPFIILFFILILGLFFRLYKLEIFYSWGHDQDLFAWIAKDIVIDHHLRLIGQETSITGVFIGPIFYYLMAVSLALFNMNPLGANISAVIISLSTIVSIYWVFSQFFGKKIGLTGAFFYAVSPGIILFDRWIVPTQPTSLWCVWFLYILLSILKGNFPLVLLGLLIGLIWHVHVAFIPLLILIPIAWWLSKMQGYRIKITAKSIVISLLLIFTLLLPFFTFEIRHGFQQIKGLTRATYEEKGDVKGMDRLRKVFNVSGRALSGIVLLDKNASLPKEFFMSLVPLLLLLIFYLYKTKIITRNQTVIIGLWIGIDLLGQFLSKRSIPEYYFANFIVVQILVISVFISTFNLKRGLSFTPLLLGMYLFAATFWFVTQPDDPGGFLQKRRAIEYIKNNAGNKGYPCVAINFIEGYEGLPNGFRYLFWLNNLKIITPGNDIPVYSIVTPWTISANEINAKFGVFGIIEPPSKIVDPELCSDSSRQLLPIWGFTN
ncbi:MAG: hypothetical protein ACD_32C00109G0005 [uncultured bacterium]|uniref:PMT family glycosyltransferase, 4-amino-4-deoxy-L-arabinose transferase n=1 Tax=Candidatus Daviesbacteria bacterium GW2011_GWC2_40_12 TaxID=1618431 RepID=A0A0G0QYR0_9BACT|nr:MAG: hypothetical protein ACD_32C00109G0005 [uncultured bacterium]KKQ85056.1 MAG: PMT family glycosyltransferase, 4-amino-4-deoxy-L-arabinose transferase [Candidatus Daviesbacteria bacterium GW2011_GWF2_38_7]KKR17177.1 MAG: PMT family glycosyltransferase, 4-amino-4-deoxy-L-arabinose transferase [Candidatus Daviesbacteria bacterium GW2011_GWA2_39_33]KKR42576.1 MAG: PMT family glycosyltransferase, 4-amino-4-deoxy-L-arabinose transferase [Candidatus Daviesbacteria bacterium GW2011_GWC2_40_12]OG